ncbi:MAG: NADH-quinone oxidoreductase subunit NuoF [Thermoplasmatota archaeon]
MPKREILICAGTGCLSSGAEEIEERLMDELWEHGLEDRFPIRKVIKKTGCMGPCDLGPIMIIEPEDTLYGNLEVTDVPKIVEQHLIKGNIVEDLLVEDIEGHNVEKFADLGFVKGQKRIVMRNSGKIDPSSIEDYLEQDGYKAAEKAVTQMDPEEIIQEIKDSGLRGRGGAGFSTGTKWDITYQSEGEQKFVVCNGDEGDPGAFMDRSILEGDPHSVIEGMMIAGYAIGADKGYVYVRAEYPLAIKNLRKAVKDAESRDLLGEDLFGTDFDFNLDIRVGAGAFVCGEETALISSIEGKQGRPKYRPPYPSQSGLWGQPTVINNVETLANVAPIILKGSEWFSIIGTEESKGTKVFAVAGDVKQTGLVEVPMGTTIEEMIELVGGVPEGKDFKAVQIGGPAGGTIPEKYIDLPIDYESLQEAGTMMGSGGFIVMDEDTCMVDVARFFLDFTQEESCGKCPPCRLGAKRMLDLLEKMTEGEAEEGDIEKLEELAETVRKTSFCGLGQAAPNPVLSTLRFFRNEYEAHVYDKECPAGQCKALKSAYVIDKETCVGCGKCAEVCPVDAISETEEGKYEIDEDKCISCGECEKVCPVDAISGGKQ